MAEKKSETNKKGKKASDSQKNAAPKKRAVANTAASSAKKSPAPKSKKSDAPLAEAAAPTPEAVLAQEGLYEAPVTPLADEATLASSGENLAAEGQGPAEGLSPAAEEPALNPEDMSAQDVLAQEVATGEVLDESASSSTGRPAFMQREVLLAWWKAARPPFYVATLIPFFLAYFAARNDVESVSLLVFTGVLLVGFLLHLAANLANDLYDHILGTDTQESIGGSRVLQDGLITVRQLRFALLGCYAATALLTALGVWITGLWGLIPIALFGALASYYYVAPPVMYGYRALGELFVFLSMGLVMTGGAYYALAGSCASYVLALSIPIGLMVAGILYYQSLPEIESDASMGKKTLAGLLGPEKAVFLFKLWWPIVWLLVITLWLAGLAAWPALVGVAAGIPLLHLSCKKIDSFDGDWLSLDKYGKYVRIMYFLTGLFLVVGVAMK